MKIKLILFFFMFTLFSKLFAQDIENRIDLKSLFLLSLEQEKEKSIKNNNLIVNNNKFFIDNQRLVNGLYSQSNYNSLTVLIQLLYTNHDILKSKQSKYLLDSVLYAKYEGLKEATLYEITKLYFKILNLKKQLQLNMKREKLLRQTLEFAKEREKIGINISEDLKSLYLQLRNVSVDRIKIYEEKANLKQMLKLLLGKELDNFNLKDYDLKSDEFLTKDESMIFYINTKEKLNRISNKLASKYIDENIQISVMQSLLNSKKDKAKQDEYTQELLKKSKTVDEVINEHKNSNTNKPWNEEDFDKIVREKLPLYMNAKVTLKNSQNKKEVKSLKLTIKNQKSKIHNTISKNFHYLISNYKTINNSKISNKNAQRNYILNEKMYKKGDISLDTLLSAQKNMIISLLNKYNARYEYLQDIVAIYYNTGKIKAFAYDGIKNEFENSIF
ncbi:TolC family protein [Malaciobacter canalis]|uniref:TolC family protein n=1 Tax=Malaciobacter canalis TaxID=1912871 RepID=UPI00384E375A